MFSIITISERAFTNQCILQTLFSKLRVVIMGSILRQHAHTYLKNSMNINISMNGVASYLNCKLQLVQNKRSVVKKPAISN